MGFPVVPAPNQCHEDDAPDAIEPVDGLGDGMVVLENNLGTAIEVCQKVGVYRYTVYLLKVELNKRNR